LTKVPYLSGTHTVYNQSVLEHERYDV